MSVVNRVIRSSYNVASFLFLAKVICEKDCFVFYNIIIQIQNTINSLLPIYIKKELKKMIKGIPPTQMVS